MKKEFDYSKSKELNIEVNGKKIKGWYVVKRGIITVNSFNGIKSTQIGGSSPESLARILLIELSNLDNR